MLQIVPDQIGFCERITSLLQHLFSSRVLNISKHMCLLDLQLIYEL